MIIDKRAGHMPPATDSAEHAGPPPPSYAIIETEPDVARQSASMSRLAAPLPPLPPPEVPIDAGSSLQPQTMTSVLAPSRPMLAPHSSSGGGDSLRSKPSSSRLFGWFSSRNTSSVDVTPPPVPMPQLSPAQIRTRQLVIDRVRELVQQPTETAAGAASYVLNHCAETCNSEKLQFSKILQEKTIDDRTPLYWAIMKRQPTTATYDSEQSVEALVLNLVEHCQSLSPDTVTELRVACAMAWDNVMFQNFRYLWPLQGGDAVILGQGENIMKDSVFVQHTDKLENAFVASIAFPAFLRRLRVSRVVDVEFVAKGRLWSLAIFTWPQLASRPGRRIPGSSEKSEKTYSVGDWLISLALLEESPPTHVDGRITFAVPDEEALRYARQAQPRRLRTQAVNGSASTGPSGSTSPPPHHLSSSPPTGDIKNASYFGSDLAPPPLIGNFSASFSHSSNASSSSLSGAGSPPAIDESRMGTKKKRSKVKPIVHLISTKGSNELAPEAQCYDVKGKKKKNTCSEVLLPLEEKTEAALNRDTSLYISADETLYLKLELRLAQHDGSCTIC